MNLKLVPNKVLKIEGKWKRKQNIRSGKINITLLSKIKVETRFILKQIQGKKGKLE